MNKLNIFGDIDKPLADWLVDRLARAGAHEHIFVHFDSPGGSFCQAMRIYRAFEQCRARTYGIVSEAASAASFILQSCDHRVMKPYGRQLLHNASVHSLNADHRELRQLIKLIDNADCDIRLIYSCRTGMNPREIELLMDKGHWLSAHQCLELGLCDSIAQPDWRVNRTAARQQPVTRTAAQPTARPAARRTASIPAKTKPWGLRWLARAGIVRPICM